MITTTLFPGRYVQGPDTLKKLGTEASRLGSKAFIICDPFVYDTLLINFKKDVEAEIATVWNKFEGECSDEEIERLVALAKDKEIDIIIGIGGGKALDTSKAVAHSLKVPVAVAPTLASTDAPCSALSVIYTNAGEFKRYLVLPKNPDLVLLDSKIVASAPSRFLVSGMGDALATWFEASSCKKSYAGNMTGYYGSMTAFALAELCFNTLLEFGVDAKIACDAGTVTPALEHVIEANTLLSGLGFESGGLATAHAVHNGLTVLEPTHAYYHGEKVAIGTLTSLILTDKSSEDVHKVFAFCESIGLPTTLADIGLVDVSDDDLMKAATVACADGETIHNEAFKVTPEQVFYALKAMDKIGRNRKNK